MRKKKREDAFLRGVLLASVLPAASTRRRRRRARLCSNRALPPAGVADNWREASQAATPASASVARLKTGGQSVSAANRARERSRARARGAAAASNAYVIRKAAH